MVVGRAEELLALTGLVDAAVAGRAGAVVVVGEAGVGKSALLDELAGTARARGIRTVEVVGVPAEKGIPGAALAVLATRLADAGSPPEAVEPLTRTGSPDPTALLEVLSRLDGTTLLVADDLHWWDAPSKVALVFAARRLACDPVAIIGAGRTELMDDRGIASLPRLDVGPVPLTQAGELARTVASGTADDVAQAVWRAVEGNTLAVLEAVVRLDADERAGRTRLPDDLRVGSGVVERWAADVQLLPYATRRALVVLAVTGEEDPVDAALAESGSSRADLEPAERAGLVVVRGSRPRFGHPLARVAVLAQASPYEVRDAHAAALAAVSVLAPTARRVHRRACHRAAAALAPDAELTRSLCEDAAALERLGAKRSAADVLELAAATEADAEVAAQMLCRASSMALDDFDDGAAARIAFVGLSREPAPTTRGRLLRIAGLATARVSDAPLGCRLLRESLDLLDGDERREAVRDLIFAQDITSERQVEIPVLAAELGPLAELAPIDRLLVAHAYDHEVGDLDTRPHLQSAFATITVHEATATGWATESVVNAGLDVGLEVSGPVLREVVSALAASGDPRRRLDGIGIDLLVSFWEGRWDELESEIDETVELSLALGRADLYSDAMRLQLCSRRADERLFAPTLERAENVMGEAGMDFWTGALPGERAMLALSLGRPEEARELLASERLDSMVRLVPHTVYADHLVTLVELLADGGEVEAAAGERDRLIALLQPTTSLLGEGFIDRACAALAPDPQAHELFCRAEERIGGGVHVFELAMTRLRHARWLRRRRRRGEAAARLQRARSVFLDLGCATWAQTCADELAAVGAGVARRDRYDVSGSLTAQERRVAEAVAEGITNDDVARRLFLSPRTVEVHLTHVYRKLGVRGRSELVRMMASAPAGGPL